MTDRTRRQFLQRSIAVSAGAVLASETASAKSVPLHQSANRKLNLGIIGVANRGGDNLNGVADENIVALCDIDDNYLRLAKQRFPQATTFNDFRRMLEMKGLDAVVVSTPDHCHAPATAMALQLGLHTYCEKPLAHTVFEARRVAELAARHKRVTQMGTQIHAESNYRRVVELVQAKAVGEVREVHVWADRIWAGGVVPTVASPIPPNIHWDLWQGPIKERNYSPVYLPATWRGYWAYGNGTLGDMACHHMDLPFWALKLRYPTRVAAEGPEVNAETTPAWLQIHYDFLERPALPAVKLIWYNGGRRPPHFAEGKLPQWGDGTLFVGDKGMLLADYDRYVLLPEKEFADYKPPTPTIPNSIGHHKEWIDACKTGGPTSCNFDYSGALSEAVLLGCVAYRTGQALDWDPKGLKCRNSAKATAMLRPEYRPGWRI